MSWSVRAAAEARRSARAHGSGGRFRLPIYMGEVLTQGGRPGGGARRRGRRYVVYTGRNSGGDTPLPVWAEKSKNDDKGLSQSQHSPA